MGYWKSLGVVWPATLVLLGLLFVLYWQLSVHPVTTLVVIVFLLVVLSGALMVEVWR